MKLSRFHKKFLFALIAFLVLAFYQRSSLTSLTEEAHQILGEKILITKQPSPTAITSVQEEAQVTKVIDGDTVEVLLNTKKEKIRIIGINTPETVDPRRPVECFGKEASKAARELLLGQKVLLHSDPTQTERDKYGRLLRYVWLLDLKRDFGQKMISDGFAYEYTYNSPYQKQTEYKEAEKQAKETGKGLWGAADCAKMSSF